MKKYLPIAIVIGLIVGLVYLGLYVSTRALLGGQNRLEQDLVIVQTTQFECLKTLFPKEATKSATPSAKFPIGVTIK